MKKTVKIEGMMCMHCVAHAKKALEALEGVAQAEVTLEPGQAVLELTQEVADQAIIDAVREAGYSVTQIA